MIVYYVTIAVSGALAALASRSSRLRPSARLADVSAFLCGTVLVLVSALRWRVGVDYWQYEALYPRYASTAWSELSLLGEPGIRVLARVGSWLVDDPATMFAAAALITVGLTVRTIYRTTSQFALGVLIYIFSTAWQLSFNGVRQHVAVAILFAGHRFVIERRMRAWAGVVAIGALFHLSALVGLALYAVPRRRLSPARLLLIMSVGVGMLFAYDALGALFDMVKQAEVSQGSYFTERVNPLRLAMAAAPLLLYSMFTAKNRLTPAEHYYVNMQFVAVATLIGALGSAYIARFYQYFVVYLSVATPAILRLRTRGLRHAILPVVLLAYAGFWYLETAQVSALSNFKWIFER